MLNSFVASNFTETVAKLDDNVVTVLSESSLEVSLNKPVNLVLNCVNSCFVASKKVLPVTKIADSDPVVTWANLRFRVFSIELSAGSK